jgi:hypothetical protein
MRTPASAFIFTFILLCSSFGYCQNRQAAIGDLNGDGQPDVVVANPSLNNVGVFLNAGGGLLSAGSFLAIAGRPNSVTLADINGDGKLDILMDVTDSSGGNHLQAMLGDGLGGFAAPVEIPTGGSGPFSNPVVADFNSDGHLDIAFSSNGNLPQISILLGDGHGSFSAPRVIPVANDTTFAADLVLLDINKDGKPDLVVNTARVTGGGFHESFLLLNDGTANFSVSQPSSSAFSSSTAGWVTAVADFDNDGSLDLLFGPNSPAVIMFGDGHGGTLSALGEQPFLGPPQGFAADVDGNQTIDLVSPVSGSYSPGNGHGGFGDAISLGLPQGSTLIAVADMNGDGKPDFIVQSGTSVSVVLNSLAAPAEFSASTQFTMSASAATTSIGLPVTISTSVFSFGGVPAGSVSFFDGAQPLGSAAVNPYGVAAITTSFSVGGVHNLTASFTGALNAGTNTLFLNSNGPGSSSVSVNSSQPTAAAPTVTLTAFPNPARVHGAVTLAANVAASSGTPTGSIVFTADGNVVGVSLLSGSGASLVLPFPTIGPHNIKASYGGDATFPQASSTTMVENIQVSVPADFTMNASPQSATIKAGQTATFNLTINPVGDLASTVGFSCSGLPAASSCSFSPATLTPGINGVSTTLTLTTTAPASLVPLSLRPPGPLVYFLCLCALAGSFVFLWRALSARRDWIRKAALAGVALAFALLLGSCSGSTSVGGGPNGTPVGTSSITVTATSATTHTTALTITVTP